jgi:hypothetical protein
MTVLKEKIVSLELISKMESFSKFFLNSFPTIYCAGEIWLKSIRSHLLVEDRINFKTMVVSGSFNLKRHIKRQFS